MGIASKLGKSSWMDRALNIGAGIGQSLMDKRSSDADRKLTAEELELRKAESRLNATQLDPFKQAKGAQLQALLNALTSKLAPSSFSGGRLTGGIGGALTPQALSEMTRLSSPDQTSTNLNSFNALAAKLGR